MSRDNDLITGLDVSIPLTATMEPMVKTWIESLEEEHSHVEATPRIKKGALSINSNDLIALTGYIPPQDSGTMDGKRFVKRSKEALEQALLRSVSLGRRAHYTWCISALSALDAGRFLDEEEE